MNPLLYIVPLFFATAVIYSMAGLGGGSTYLALLLLFSFPLEVVPQVALICNLVVVSAGCWHFWRAGHLDLKRVIPFMATSIPLAFAGGAMPIGKGAFSLILGLSLFIAAIRLLISERVFEGHRRIGWRRAWAIGLPVGALFGFVSGCVGIGGGIYLSPLLLLIGWADSKQSAAAASLFILVNSAAGLAGQVTKGGLHLDAALMIPLIAAVALGGQIGSRLGAGRISRLVLQRTTAVLMIVVASRLLVNLVMGGSS